MTTITKKELVIKISQKHGIHPNEVRNVIQSFLDEMTDCLAKGDRLEFRDFGVFEIVVRKRKIGRNPKNASVAIVIPERPAVKFTPGKEMKKRKSKNCRLQQIQFNIKNPMSLISPNQQTEEIDHYLFLLQDLVWRILEDAESLSSLKKRFGDLFTAGYPEGLQLPRAYLALLSHLLNLDPFPIHPEQFPNGTALLDTLGWCESREIPEPMELAQLGVLWMILGVRLKNEVLQRAGLKIAVWHVHLLDSQGYSHLSVWSRARSFRLSTFSLWKYVLFTMAYRLTGQSGFDQLADIAKGEAWDPKAFPVKLLILVPSKLSHPLHHSLRPFAEEMTVGIIKFSTLEMSMMAHLSGWNSGLFSFHKKEVALINAGPQVGSYDALDQFGVCRTWGVRERPFQEMIWEKTAYHSRLKGWTRLLSLPLWLELDTRLQAGQATFEVTLQEKDIDIQLSMILFLKCPKLIIGGKYHLAAGSLEGYEGKSLPLELQGTQEKMILHPEAALSMQVIPLAGGDHFWGAHFLAAFPIDKTKAFKVEVK